MRKIGFSVLLLLALPFARVYATDTNAGFVQGLWYSTDVSHIFALKPVRIYGAIRNNTGSDLTGTVAFLDNDKQIDKKTVQAIDGHIIEAWADWSPTYGTHTISATLSRVELSKVGSSTQEVTTTSGLAEDTFFVDQDTDSDGIGNKTDSDDDNDKIPDVIEIAQGTDPLVKDAPVQEMRSATVQPSSDGQSTVSNKTQHSTESSSTAPQGLEQYLTHSPAETVLASVTDVINTAKQNLDAYREDRTQKQLEAGQVQIQKTPTNADGFGEITRTTNAGNSLQAPSLVQNAFLKNITAKDGKGIKGESFLDKAITVLKAVGNTLFSGSLALLSLLLGHPGLLQFGILLLILFFLIMFAARFGRRPRKA